MTNKATKIITYILLILAVITVIGVVAHFTNGFTSDFKTFYVTVDGKGRNDFFRRLQSYDRKALASGRQIYL